MITNEKIKTPVTAEAIMKELQNLKALHFNDAAKLNTLFEIESRFHVNYTGWSWKLMSDEQFYNNNHRFDKALAQFFDNPDTSLDKLISILEGTATELPKLEIKLVFDKKTYYKNTHNIIITNTWFYKLIIRNNSEFAVYDVLLEAPLLRFIQKLRPYSTLPSEQVIELAVKYTESTIDDGMFPKLNYPIMLDKLIISLHYKSEAGQATTTQFRMRHGKGGYNEIEIPKLIIE